MLAISLALILGAGVSFRKVQRDARALSASAMAYRGAGDRRSAQRAESAATVLVISWLVLALASFAMLVLSFTLSGPVA